MEPLQDVVQALLSPTADISHAQLEGKVTLVRVDFNVPIVNGLVADYSRVDAALPTIRALQDARARVVLISHLGRPKPAEMTAAQMEQTSMKALLPRLRESLGSAFVGMAPGTTGAAVQARVQALKNSEAGLWVPHKDQAIHVLTKSGRRQVLLLENVRFLPGEETCAPDTIAALASLGDAFVMDAFGVCHRDQASVSGLARTMPVAYPGVLVRQEIKYLTTHLQRPDRPFAVIVGGAKVADKIGVLWAMIERADKVLIGGRMAFTFLAAKGVAVGKTAIEESWLTRAAQMIDYAAQKMHLDARKVARVQGVELLLPVDVTCTYDLDADASCCTRPLTVSCCSAASPCIPDNAFGADIGPKTASLFSAALQGCQTIFWNGPMGKFEQSAYAEGTEEVAHSVAAAGKSGATTIIAGGDSVSAVKQLNLAQHISHLSTGGGASLELLEGKGMVGLRALAARHLPTGAGSNAAQQSDMPQTDKQRELAMA